MSSTARGAGRPGWSLAVLLIALVVASPVLAVAAYAVGQGGLRMPEGLGGLSVEIANEPTTDGALSASILSFICFSRATPCVT